MFRVVDYKKPITGRAERSGKGYKIYWHNGEYQKFTIAEFNKFRRRRTIEVTAIV
tara:strand:- start:12318 stop:12482 length:165 start_codon:yes stop_codon:yes gene_type:complete